uniref:Uncharacterized protein n=1 Tax=Amphimedon queenslandica TaxID=400682 RepID=A0A1X7SDB6_AMPQE
MRPKAIGKKIKKKKN